jgi:hypothetical protein
VPFADLVSVYNMTERVQKLEIADDAPNGISSLVSFLLFIFFGIGYPILIQSHLEATPIWRCPGELRCLQCPCSAGRTHDVGPLTAMTSPRRSVARIREGDYLSDRFPHGLLRISV